MSNTHLSSFPSLRLRRGRSSQWIRNLLTENNLTSNDLIWPIFICEGENKKDEISSMPNVYRYSIDRLDEISETANELGINLIALFPYTPEEKKTEGGEESILEIYKKIWHSNKWRQSMVGYGDNIFYEEMLE